MSTAVNLRTPGQDRVTCCIGNSKAAHVGLLCIFREASMMIYDLPKVDLCIHVHTLLKGTVLFL